MYLPNTKYQDQNYGTMTNVYQRANIHKGTTNHFEDEVPNAYEEVEGGAKYNGPDFADIFTANLGVNCTYYENEDNTKAWLTFDADVQLRG